MRGNASMKIKAEITCVRCGRDVRGILTLDDRNCVVDSEGFMVFADGGVCDTCLKEPSN